MKTAKYIITFFTIAAAMVLLSSCSGESTTAIRVGDTIASFTAPELEGSSYSLASYKGKPVIVRFFLLNCPYCKADTPI